MKFTYPNLFVDISDAVLKDPKEGRPSNIGNIFHLDNPDIRAPTHKTDTPKPLEYVFNLLKVRGSESILHTLNLRLQDFVLSGTNPEGMLVSSEVENIQPDQKNKIQARDEFIDFLNESGLDYIVYDAKA